MTEEEYEALRKKNEETYNQLHLELKQFSDYLKYKQLIPKMVMKSYEKYVEEQKYNPETIKDNPEVGMKNLKID